MYRIEAETNDEEDCVDQEVMRWFYLDECGEWHMFDVNPSQQCEVTNGDIERNYRRNSDGHMEYSIAEYTYRFDFSEMKHINVTTGRQRPINRRLLGMPQQTIPSHWDLPLELIPLDSSTEECKEVVKKFAKTLPNVPIRSIIRIQNIKLWKSFCRKKAQLMEMKQMPIEERRLFHGTVDQNIQPICDSNFDLKFAGKHGAAYGKGIYFARNAAYSKTYCVSSSKTMILARVLVGEYTEGHEDLCQAPPKDRAETSFYDSCVDRETDPNIFVVFDSNQVYPKYLIKF